MTLDGADYLDTLETLRSDRSEVVLPCTKEEAREVRKFLFQNGVSVDLLRLAPGTYRFIRREGARA